MPDPIHDPFLEDVAMTAPLSDIELAQLQADADSCADQEWASKQIVPRLLATIDRLKEEREWRPIEEAAEGQWVLAVQWLPSVGMPAQLPTIYQIRNGEACWPNGGVSSAYPTHFVPCPIPAPPSDKE